MVERVDRHREWKCLTVRQPYAWAIIKGAKDVENREQKRMYMGRLHIHAGRTEWTERVDYCVGRVAKHVGVFLLGDARRLSPACEPRPRSGHRLGAHVRLRRAPRE